MIKPIALTFAVAMAFAPSAAPAQYYGPAGAPGATDRPMRTPQRSARVARPWIGQAPREDIPPISRNPNDCVKTMCTCLSGGGC